MRDAFPVIPTPASLEDLSEEIWRHLNELAKMAETCAPAFEETARNLRSFLTYLRAAEELRASPVETQSAAALVLFAALREANSSMQSLPAMLSRFNFALTPTGPRSN